MDNAFLKILEGKPPKGRKKELNVQDYLELNSELIPTPGLLNHHLHFRSVISQFPIDNSLISDFAYITKNTIQWKIFLIELKSPDKKIFKSTKSQISFRSEFNEALSQIRSWKVFIRNNKQAVINKVKPLLHPLSMQNNPIDFSYVLVYGRSEEYEASRQRSDNLYSLIENESIYFHSYDSLSRSKEESGGYKKNILKINKNIYSFKHLSCQPLHLFAYMSPNDFSLSKKDETTLKSWGYDIDSWLKGHKLDFNGKYPSNFTDEENYPF